MDFVKMHGAGNDYVFVDVHDAQVDDASALARFVSNRNFGIGADGLILIGPSEVAQFRMTMFNADGSEAQMCGNGLRCVARYLHDSGLAPGPDIDIETGAGVLCARLLLDGERVHAVRLDMGAPRLNRAEVPMAGPPGTAIRQPLSVAGLNLAVTCVSMGNPHCVVFVENPDEFPVEEVGPLIERHPWFPERVNVEFVSVLSPVEFRQRTWERGSGETMACGTGACAVCVAGVLEKRLDRRARGHLRGGDLDLEWDPESGHVFLTGPAVESFRGRLNPEAMGAASVGFAGSGIENPAPDAEEK